jgi:hypothetical protein
MADTQMGLEVSGHGFLVFGHDDPSCALRPQQQFRVLGPQRQIRGIADTGRIEREQPERVVVLNGIPQRPAQVLIKDKGQRHGCSVESLLSGSGEERQVVR